MAGLIVKFIDTPAVPGGKAVALCDEDGEMLPMQSRAVLSNGVNETTEITVTFAVDGKHIRISE